jgi:predicted extracellular nuclease
VLTSAVDPRFIDTKSRPALAQTFEQLATGARFTVVVNHLKSKGSACDDVGDPDVGDGQGNCNLTRKAAAEALVDWLARDPTRNGDADFLIIGDLNSYAMEDPITAIRAGPDDAAGTADDYRNLVARYLGPYAYSYVFDGQAGYLDHALSSSSLTPQVRGVAEWHINADEPDVVDYDTSFKGPGQRALYEANAYRSSDHDPILVGLGLATTFDDLCRLTRRLVGNAGVADGLCDKLATAEAADQAGDAKERDNALRAYRRQVDAQTGKSITAVDAATLKSLSLTLQ